MSLMLSTLAVIMALIAPFCEGVSSTAPSWVTSSYLQAGTETIFDTLTGNDENPEFVVTFRTALSGVPRLAYGIKNYRGNDYMGI